MDRAIINSIIRFFALWALQTLVLNQIYWGWDNQVYLHIHLYPLFILLLPFKTPRSLVLLLAFALGILIDFAAESYGIHAASLVFTAYMRSIIFRLIKPREGYSIKDTPTKHSLGDNWFLRYAGLMMYLHLFFYFSVEAFTFVYFGTIILKLFVSWVGSMFFLLMSVYITNPRD